MIGTVTGSSIGKNRNGTANVRILQVEITDPIDVQEVEYYAPSGDDSPPVNGSLVRIIDLGDNWKIGIACNDNVEPSMDRGEKKLYSIDANGTIAAFINWLKDGIIELNGNNDFAVRFNALEAQIDALNTKYDAHTHPDPVSGNTGTPSNAPLGLDISGAKVDEVKLP